MSILRAIWGAVMSVTHAIGRVVTFVLLAVIYVVVVAPIAVVLWVVRRQPLYSRESEQTTWCRRDRGPADLEAAERPF